ncbi:MAG: hypothetical protein Q4F24_17235 [Eubacteriales bacterium]|nr:hypothetical protein [Eubacteriales bacterium]
MAGLQAFFIYVLAAKLALEMMRTAKRRRREIFLGLFLCGLEKTELLYSLLRLLIHNAGYPIEGFYTVER